MSSLLADARLLARQQTDYERRVARHEYAEHRRWVWRAICLLFKWGIVLFAPLAVVVPGWLSAYEGRGAVGMAVIFQTIACLKLDPPQVRAFDLLAAPSPAAWAAAAWFRNGWWWALAGLSNALTFWFVGAADTLPSLKWPLLAGLLLTPLLCGVQGVDERVGEHSRRDESMMPAVLFVIIAIFLDTKLETAYVTVAWLVLVPVARMIFGDFGGFLRGLLALVAIVPIPWLLVLPRNSIEEGEQVWMQTAPAIALVLIVWHLHLTLRDAGRVEVSKSEDTYDDETSPSVWVSGVTFSPRRLAPGAGLWKARWRYLIEDVSPSDAAPDRPLVAIVKRRALRGLLLALGPLLAAAALLFADFGRVNVALAVMAGLLSSRWGAVDLERRLWLWGVGLREMVLHDLRVFVLITALPTIGVATLVWLVTGAGETGVTTLLWIAGTLLVRVGLPGLGRHAEMFVAWRVGLGFLAYFVALPSWDVAASSARFGAGIVVPIGLSLVIVRLLRARESTLEGNLRE